MTLPATETLLLEPMDHALFITLNRPQQRNAMSLDMVRELMAVFDAIRADRTVRAVVLRGAEGHFCAGGDIKDMATARAQGGQGDGKDNAFYKLNREFGRLISQIDAAPQVVVAVLEGAVLGGGFGLACVSDVAIATPETRFGLPETSLGIPPAQIAPFVVKRIGVTQARRLALLGMKFNGLEALRMGIVHELCDSSDLGDRIIEVLAQIKQCAPEANAVTKALMLSVGHKPLDDLLDGAAVSFAAAVQGPEGIEGTMAFMQKRAAKWVE